LIRCRNITERVIARVPELVFIYPGIEYEFPAEPSPLIATLAHLEAAALPAPASCYRSVDAASLVEQIVDPPPPLVAQEIAGGASTLELQARCPLRAFIESRLRAKPLESVSRGLDPRQRGILTHRALELLYGDKPTRRQLEALPARALRERVAGSIRRAIRERMRGAGQGFGVLLQLEQERLEPLIEAFVAVDIERNEFTVATLETRQSIAISGCEIACRIDRIDRLADGSLAIVDYKTGSRASPTDWFKPRLLQPQLPLYLMAVDEPVRAMVFAVIKPAAVAYQGYWMGKGEFPGRFRPLPSGLDWVAQRAHWAAQLEALVAEYTHGDTRIFLDQEASAKGPVAPLTRVFENLAFANAEFNTGSCDE
jgi:RecB family exonuclease